MSFHILINLADSVTENGVILDQVRKKLPKVLDTFLNTKATRSMLDQNKKVLGFVGLDLDAKESKDAIDINVQEMCYCGNCPESEILSEADLLDRLQNNKRNKETKMSKSVGQTDPKLEINYSEIQNVKNRESFSKESYVMSQRFGSVGKEKALSDLVTELIDPKSNKQEPFFVTEQFIESQGKFYNKQKSNSPEAKEKVYAKYMPVQEIYLTDKVARDSIEILYKEIDLLRQELFESRQLDERSEIKGEIASSLSDTLGCNTNTLQDQKTINLDNSKKIFLPSEIAKKFDMKLEKILNGSVYSFILTENNVEDAIELLDIPVTNVSLGLKNEEEDSIFHTECSIGDIVFVSPNTMKYLGYLSVWSAIEL